MYMTRIKVPNKSLSHDCFEAKTALAAKHAIIGGQSLSQTDKFFDTIWVCGFFLSVKFATSLLALLAGG